MTRYGYWLNLDTLEWTPLAPLVYNPIGDQANGMNSFRGRPTIFGNPECNDGGECPETGVVQVMTKADLAWDLIAICKHRTSNSSTTSRRTLGT